MIRNLRLRKLCPKAGRQSAPGLLAALLLVALLSCMVQPLSAQSFTATLQGTVSDSTGAVVPGAEVVIVNEGTNVSQTKQTDQRGAYFFTMLPPGSYKLTVQLPGFQKYVRSGMVLQVQQQASVDVTLQPGEVSTTVEVTGEAPRLDAVNATLGRVVENKSILSMPLGSRNTLDLAALAPGVSGSTGFTGTNFTSSGTRNSQSDVLIDGVTVTVQEQNGGVTDVKFRPSVEAVQEFKVQTNSFSAEYGNTGGTVVNVVTRSGTNGLHGSLFEFHRNSAFNAQNFFANRSGRSLTPFRRNQFGGAVGGPVYIPKVYNGKNRTFFFFHHEGTKQSSQSTTLETVPTLLEKQGDFSQTMDSKGRVYAIFNPFSAHKDASGNWIRDPFPENKVPVSMMNPVAAKAVRFYPDPTLPGNPFTHTQNFFMVGTSASNNYQNTTKIDHNLTEMQRISGRYSRYRVTNESPNFWESPWNPYDSGASMDFTQNVTVDYTNTLSPTTVLNLRWGVARQFGTRTPFCGECGYDASIFPFSGPLDIAMPPRFEPEGYLAVGVAPWARVRRGEDVNHIVANMTKIVGAHTMKFGGDARLYRLNYGQPGVNVANFAFNRRTTMADPFRSDSLQGNGLASMFLGWGSGGGQRTDAFSAWASQSYGFFFQDDFQLTSKLTLNLGLRYELDMPRTERYNRVSWVDLEAATPITVPGYSNLRGGLRFATDDIRSPFDIDKNNWAPRFGFAYQFVPKMVMRGGYGIYYGISLAQNRSPLGQGFKTSTNWQTTLDGGVTRYAALENPFPDGINQPIGSSQGLASYIGLGISGPIRNWGIKPYYQQWSFSVERELPFNSVVEIAYAGNRGVHLYWGGNEGLNRIDTDYWALGPKLSDQVDNPFYGIIKEPTSALSKPKVSRSQLLRPHPQFTGLSGTPPPSANSIYHSVQMKFSKRYSHGLNFSGHYTIGKMIDDNSTTGSVSWLGYSHGGIQNWENLSLERAVSMYDITHRMVLDFTYELPVGRNRALGGAWNPWIDAVLGGWQFNGIVTVQSGMPLVPGLTGGILPDGTQRPNLNRDASIDGPVVSKLNRYLDPEAFSRPEPYTMGTSPRIIDRVRAPGHHGADVSLFKNVYFGSDRGRYLQIRGEAFNVTNTPIFGAPDMTVGSANFGVISSQANGPRQLQLGAKIYF